MSHTSTLDSPAGGSANTAESSRSLNNIERMAAQYVASPRDLVATMGYVGEWEVHTVIIAAWSGWFRQKLARIQPSSDGVYHLDLTAVSFLSYDEMGDLFRFVYRGTLSESQVRNPVLTYMIARYFHMRELERRALEVLRAEILAAARHDQDRYYSLLASSLRRSVMIIPGQEVSRTAVEASREAAEIIERSRRG
ncbi:hypothetical protein BD289DRAFT_508205 [Coniella lustricola]|uniref:BTB domain-containing protein n=1 Tax=Coniella lustricola TaxID=2025994 RepID=A0A2T2ZZQ0_9PEZI|nr:hypothetical protein BD289DRAFT_508205 [Coniella lustricola]